MKALRNYMCIIMLSIIACAFINSEHYNNEEKVRFVKLLDSIRQDFSDSTIVEYVASMDFYNEGISSPEEYAFYFSYCIKHHLESYDEGISLRLYKVFTKYPQKFDELCKYLKFLMPEHVLQVKTHLCWSIAYDWIYNRLDVPSFEDFITTYPFFNEPNLLDSYKLIYDSCLSDFTHRQNN